ERSTISPIVLSFPCKRRRISASCLSSDGRWRYPVMVAPHFGAGADRSGSMAKGFRFSRRHHVIVSKHRGVARTVRTIEVPMEIRRVGTGHHTYKLALGAS